jgi:hypothetical protein
MAAGGTERTSGYFGDQTPSELKKPCFPFRIRFYHFWRTPLLQPLLNQSCQSARFQLYKVLYHKGIANGAEIYLPLFLFRAMLS